MASKHTEKYLLNQWEGADQVLRTDFNEDNLKIEKALAGLAEGLACRGNCQVYLYSYTGTGESGPVEFTFPHRPLFVTLQGGETWVCAVRPNPMCHGRMAANTYLFTPVAWGERSFSIGTSAWTGPYCCNTSGTSYSLLALLDAGD